MSRILHSGHGLPCGAGRNAFAITPEGKILACPIAYEFKWNILGDFNDYKKIDIGEPCKSCEYYNICGGRCLFAYKEMLWEKEGFNEICNVTKFLIREIEKYKDIAKKFVPMLKYPPYNNTTEIIP